MASPNNVELEAAKFLHKLIQESKDEPTKLATKLYVILQHMKASGKEHSMPYQVISRAMETVVNQHGIDIEALRSSRLSLAGGSQIGDPAVMQNAGPSQLTAVVRDAQASRPPVGPSRSGHDFHQGSVLHRSNHSFDNESPSSLDSRSANSMSQERNDSTIQSDGRKVTSKRKRGDPSSPMEQVDNPQQVDPSTGMLRMGKTSLIDQPRNYSAKGGEVTSLNAVSSGGQVEHFPSLSGSTRTMFNARQEVPNSMEKQLDSTNFGHLMSPASNSKNPEEVEVTSYAASGLQPTGSLPSVHDILSSRAVWNQNKAGSSFEKPPLSRFSPNVLRSSVIPEGLSQPLVASSSGSSRGALTSLPDKTSEDGGNSSMTSNANKLVQDGRKNSILDMSMTRSMASRDLGKSPVSQTPPFGRLFKEQQLKQLRAQCLVFLAFRNGLVPKKPHLEIALGNVFPQEGGNSDGSRELIEQKGKAQSSNELSTIPEVSPFFGSFQNARETDRALSGDSLSKEPGNPRLGDSSVVPSRRTDVSPEPLESQGIFATASQQHMNSPDDPKASELQTRRGTADGLSKPGIINGGECDEEDKSTSTDLPACPKYTMSDKWIMDHQKKKLVIQKSWLIKQQKAQNKIAACYERLKGNVNSSEDISAKTRSVIELKKLQLLKLQRRLRSDFLNDFFKPIGTDLDRLKSCKKHRHGRRVKQLEKYEQKMKEERQKRIRERQKEFFGDIEVHKERLDDVFKVRRERCKSFNRYVKEFHKRKERVHREKIDRIQREKINLLKINDVEGYLRMVQDAKSDRVKQLLKETEKYLQKLGSKLREAKAIARHSEHEMDDARSTIVDENDIDVNNEDESDQAKHYKESNEKYYKMAHSIKETITEQPTALKGGKLREYQMNGLRWLVSLYNNQLNGILADEMGLGKTVQVISLICYLMETKNDRGPFLVVVPSSVLPGWESEINFWAPGIHKIVYAGPPEERRRLFKEQIVHKKFNVLLTTYEYLMNKHDRPKLSKLDWHYIIIDEGHRIKNASCKLNADLKHYSSSHRLLLTGTPLQNNLDELWALLNFLLPNIFNSSEDFSQWFNKPFESNGDSSADEALLSEEENLLIINRLHQVLRPFVLRRLKHKVENELPEKIERLIRCEASAYQKLLMKRVEENLGSLGPTKSRSVHNSVMELRNICNHPYLSQLHADEVDSLIPKHYLPPIVRLCGKLEMLDRLLPKLKATDHRVLFFSTMTRLLDVMEEYLATKQYRYLRLDGHTSGNDRGALIELFNQPGSPYFIFLLSIRAGGVGVNLQAADTVIIFDTDWNPQVDLQAQARAHRIGQKKDVLVLRFETVQTVEEQVRASAEHKLGVANQSITAGFFDNNTSAEDRREYLESLLRECKKEEAAPVLDDDSLNDVLARSEAEIDVFESVDRQRREQEMEMWKKMVLGQRKDSSESLPSLPSRLVTDDDLKAFYEAMKVYDVPKAGLESEGGVKRKGEFVGGLDTQHYGRGKRAREIRSYEEQWTEEEFEKMCQADSPESSKLKEEIPDTKPMPEANVSTPAPVGKTEPGKAEPHAPLPHTPTSVPPQLQQSKEVTPPTKRGRGRPKKVTASNVSPAATATTATGKVDAKVQRENASSSTVNADVNSSSGRTNSDSGIAQPSSEPPTPPVAPPPGFESHSAVLTQVKGKGRKQSGGEGPRRRGRRQGSVSATVPDSSAGPDPKLDEKLQINSTIIPETQAVGTSGTVFSSPVAHCPEPLPTSGITATSGSIQSTGPAIALSSQAGTSVTAVPTVSDPIVHHPFGIGQTKMQAQKTQSGVGTPRRRGRKQVLASAPIPAISAGSDSRVDSQSGNRSVDIGGKAVEQASGVQAPVGLTGQDLKSPTKSDQLAQFEQTANSQTMHTNVANLPGPTLQQMQDAGVHDVASETRGLKFESSSKAKVDDQLENLRGATQSALVSSMTEKLKDPCPEGKTQTSVSTLNATAPVPGLPSNSFSVSTNVGGIMNTTNKVAVISASGSQSSFYPSNLQPGQPTSSASEYVQAKRQGRKTPSKMEGQPRRRGKKQTPVSAAVPDASSGQDQKFNLEVQNKSEVSSGSGVKGVQESDTRPVKTDVKAQAREVQSQQTVPTLELKRKDQLAHSDLNKLMTSSTTVLDGAAGSIGKSTGSVKGKDSGTPMRSQDKTPVDTDGGNPALSRIQVTNINDVARVMKAAFSATCSIKPKVVEPTRSEGRDSCYLSASNKTIEGVSRGQSSENNENSSMPNTETVISESKVGKQQDKCDTETDSAVPASMLEPPVSDVNVGEAGNKTTTGSGEIVADARQLADNNSSAMPNPEMLVPESNFDKQKDKCETEIDSTVPVPVLEPSASGVNMGEAGSKTTAGSSDNMVDAIELANNESSGMPDTETIVSESIVDEQKDKCETQTDSAAPASMLELPVCMEISQEGNFSSKTEDSSDEFLDSGRGSSAGYPSSLDDPGNQPEATSSVPTSMVHSGVDESHDMTKSKSCNRLEISSEECLQSSSCDTKADTAGNCGIALTIPTSLNPSGTVEHPCVTEARSVNGMEFPAKDTLQSPNIVAGSSEVPVISVEVNNVTDHPKVASPVSASPDNPESTGPSAMHMLPSHSSITSSHEISEDNEHETTIPSTELPVSSNFDITRPEDSSNLPEALVGNLSEATSPNHNQVGKGLTEESEIRCLETKPTEYSSEAFVRSSEASEPGVGGAFEQADSLSRNDIAASQSESKAAVIGDVEEPSCGDINVTESSMKEPLRSSHPDTGGSASPSKADEMSVHPIVAAPIFVSVYHSSIKEPSAVASVHANSEMGDSHVRECDSRNGEHLSESGMPGLEATTKRYPSENAGSSEVNEPAAAVAYGPTDNFSGHGAASLRTEVPALSDAGTKDSPLMTGTGSVKETENSADEALKSAFIVTNSLEAPSSVAEAGNNSDQPKIPSPISECAKDSCIEEAPTKEALISTCIVTSTLESSSIAPEAGNISDQPKVPSPVPESATDSSMEASSAVEGLKSSCIATSNFEATSVVPEAGNISGQPEIPSPSHESANDSSMEQASAIEALKSSCIVSSTLEAPSIVPEGGNISNQPKVPSPIPENANDYTMEEGSPMEVVKSSCIDTSTLAAPSIVPEAGNILDQPKVPDSSNDFRMEEGSAVVASPAPARISGHPHSIEDDSEKIQSCPSESLKSSLLDAKVSENSTISQKSADTFCDNPTETVCRFSGRDHSGASGVGDHYDDSGVPSSEAKDAVHSVEAAVETSRANFSGAGVDSELVDMSVGDFPKAGSKVDTGTTSVNKTENPIAASAQTSNAGVVTVETSSILPEADNITSHLDDRMPENSTRLPVAANAFCDHSKESPSKSTSPDHAGTTKADADSDDDSEMPYMEGEVTGQSPKAAVESSQANESGVEIDFGPKDDSSGQSAGMRSKELALSKVGSMVETRDPSGIGSINELEMNVEESLQNPCLVGKTSQSPSSFSEIENTSDQPRFASPVSATVNHSGMEKASATSAGQPKMSDPHGVSEDDYGNKIPPSIIEPPKSSPSAHSAETLSEFTGPNPAVIDVVGVGRPVESEMPCLEDQATDCIDEAVVEGPETDNLDASFVKPDNSSGHDVADLHLKEQETSTGGILPDDFLVDSGKPITKFVVETEKVEGFAEKEAYVPSSSLAAEAENTGGSGEKEIQAGDKIANQVDPNGSLVSVKETGRSDANVTDQIERSSLEGGVLGANESQNMGEPSSSAGTGNEKVDVSSQNAPTGSSFAQEYRREVEKDCQINTSQVDRTAPAQISAAMDPSPSSLVLEKECGDRSPVGNLVDSLVAVNELKGSEVKEDSAVSLAQVEGDERNGQNEKSETADQCPSSTEEVKDAGGLQNVSGESSSILPGAGAGCEAEIVAPPDASTVAAAPENNSDTKDSSSPMAAKEENLDTTVTQ